MDELGEFCVVDQPEETTTPNPPPEPAEAEGLPPGNHPLEVAARRGIGPLSPLGQEVWHGQARPCVTCGQVLPRSATQCDYCEQDLTEGMLEKMRAFAGPWFVLEHVRPFPGVSLERIIRQIRRGVITESSIVRGPSTDFQWRFAVETPGLCRYFGRCWRCYERVSPSDTFCPKCIAHLSFEQPRAVAPMTAAGLVRRDAPQPVPVAPLAPSAASPSIPTAPAAREMSPVPSASSGTSLIGREIARPPVASAFDSGLFAPPGPGEAVDSAVLESQELRRLSEVVDRFERIPAEDLWDAPPRLFGIRATWIAAAILGLLVVILLMVTRSQG